MTVAKIPEIAVQEVNNDSQNNNIVFKILSVLILGAMIIIPLLEALGRRFFGMGIPGAAGWVQHMTLWIGLLGAVLATINRNHLSLSLTQFIRDKNRQASLRKLIEFGSISILLILTWSAAELVYYEYSSAELIGGWFPVWLAQATMPVTFFLIAIIIIKKDILENFSLNKQLIWPGLLLVLVVIFFWLDMTVANLILLLILSLLGMPIYIILAGISLLLFSTQQIPFVALPSETYQMVTQPVLPSIPLFALAGTVLAAGGAPQRLLRLMKAWMEWMPGGLVISSVIGCAFFTAITGASGVTILALGGILLPVLLAGNYSEKFSTGLLTASGSVGLLFPPSLPVILYGVYAHVPIDQLFLAALLPGIILVSMLIFVAPVLSKRSSGGERSRFNLHEAGKATYAAIGDLLLPVIVVGGFFGGYLTIVETAAMTALWAILLETVIYKKMKFRRELLTTMVESTGLIGALLIVLGMALGLVSYLVDAQIPVKAAAWVTSVIHSKWLFLLMLNVLLLAVGALMDIFSAIVIVVPLLVPVGLAFGVDPVHLGIIFLANLELGYLTPPIGMNLFLSSLRFKKSLYDIWKTVIPFLIIFIIWVLLITYIPAVSLGLGGK